MSKTITQKQLKEILHYNPDTGVFTRKILLGGQMPGSIAGNNHHSGYIYISIKKKHYSSHRLAFLYMHGYMPEQIDHINGIRDDNRIINLRHSSHEINMKNKAKYKNNTSGYAGVVWRKDTKKWRVIIGTISLGSFKDKDEAIRVRKEAEIKYGYHENHGRD